MKTHSNAITNTIEKLRSKGCSPAEVLAAAQRLDTPDKLGRKRRELRVVWCKCGDYFLARSDQAHYCSHACWLNARDISRRKATRKPRPPFQPSPAAEQAFLIWLGGVARVNFAEAQLYLEPNKRRAWLSEWMEVHAHDQDKA